MQGTTPNMPGGVLVIAFMASMVLRYVDGTLTGGFCFNPARPDE